MKTAKAVRYDEIEGKVVSGAGFDWTHMMIAFTDGTVLALSANDDQEGAQIDFEQSEINLCGSWSGAATEAGVLTRDEYLEARKAADEARIARLKKELAYLESSK